MYSRVVPSFFFSISPCDQNSTLWLEEDEEYDEEYDEEDE